MDDLVNIAEQSTASMHSFQAGYEPQLVPASHAVDGIIADTGNFIAIFNVVKSKQYHSKSYVPSKEFWYNKNCNKSF